MNKAYFAGGCFWCLSDYILSLNLDGVIDINVGYCGGLEKDANYKLVKSQKTKHRETLEIIYDETKISLLSLLKTYVSYVDIHDKTGQFIDKGYSYTLALFYSNTNEKELYTSFVSSLEKPAYISIEKFSFFIKAEELHQHYAVKNPEKFKNELISSNRICHLAIKKKIEKIIFNIHLFVFLLKERIKMYDK